MDIRTTLVTSSLIAASLVSGAAQAALQGRDLNGSVGSFEAYYDTVLNITWLANANMNGAMTWATANTWAANLSFTDGVNVYDNWRLPTALQPDASCDIQSGGASSGTNCTGSEMGHLFYTELGGIAFQYIGASGDPDVAKFTSFEFTYWTATVNATDTGMAWDFDFDSGDQYPNSKSELFYALAVSPGDVAAVPEAETYALMLAGLGLIGWRARRRG